MPLQATSGAASYDAFGGGVAAVPNYIEDVFSTWLIKPPADFTNYSINNGIDLLGKGGMTWFKARDAAQNNIVYDTVRGSSSGNANALITNSTSAQQTTFWDFVTPNSNGFTVNFASGGGQLTNGGINYASWTFREQPKFFDVVTYTGTGTASQTVSHNLGSAPGCIIIKRTDSTSNWFVGHNYDANRLLYLNTTAAATTLGWNSWIFGSTTFRTPSISGSPDVNESGATYVAYLFAHNAGGFGLTGTDNVISCGSFTSSSIGLATVDLGYEPQWILYKGSNGVTNWQLVDNMRGFVVGAANSGTSFLNANTSAAEGTNPPVGITNTGFNFDGAANITYIYIAIRRGPMRVPTTGTSVFAPIARTGTGANATVSGVGFPPDLFIGQIRGTAGYWNGAVDRLRGVNKRLVTSQTNAEDTTTDAVTSFTMDGVTLGADSNGFVNESGKTYIEWNFKRAPGFFDEVCYTGTSVARTVAHNLTVAPELMIVKSRSLATTWAVYAAPLGNTKAVYLDQTSAEDVTSRWNNTTPTSTVFSVNNNIVVNDSGATYVSYLFASCPGVSKVGSYTGTGAINTINCGFTGGARFVMVKRTDAAGDWYVFDSARGLVSGVNPYLLFNSTAAEADTGLVTNSVGFRVTTTGASTVNISGATYIFLAIA